jgi:hypothetical protein
MIFCRHFEGLCKANYPIKVFRSGAHVSFLRSAVDEGFDPHIFVDIEHAHSFWPMKLVTGGGNEVNRGLTKIKWKVTHGLYGVGMKNSIISFAKFSYCVQVQHVANLVVGMHQCHQAFFAAFRKQAAQMVHVDVPIRQNIYKFQFGFTAMLQVFYCVQRCMMFDRRSNDHPAAKVPYCRVDGRVGTFSSAGGEEDFSGVRV